MTENSVSESGTLLEESVQRILVIGDSISAGFGLDKSKGWVALLADHLGSDYQLINASISGDTSSGGRYRLTKALMTHQPHLVVIELGGNDALRGTPVKQIRENIRAMVNASRDSGARVMLLGMQIPPNYGERYTQAFAAVYEELATGMGTLFVPFLLDGVAGVEGMMQADGIHPTEAAQAIMMEHVQKALVGFTK